MSTLHADSITQEHRDEFRFVEGQVFLNHAGHAPFPRRAQKLLNDLIRRRSTLAEGENVDAETFRLLPEAKSCFGQLIGQSQGQIAFSTNASFGLNMILWGLALQPGERILIPEIEFPALVYATQNIAAARDLEIIRLACPDGILSEDALTEELRRGAAVLGMSWVQYFNGYRNDLEQIAALCHEHGCFLLADIMQGAGVVPLQMRDWGVDGCACGTQKWLLGGSGGGFFAIADRPIRPVTPPFRGWLSHDWGYTFGDLQRWDRPVYQDGRRFEVGSYPDSAVRTAYAGVSLLAEIGMPAVFAHVDDLTGRLADGLSGCDYTVARFPRPSQRAGIAIISGPDTEALHTHLVTQGFHCALREGNIRVSPHFYNTFADIDRFLEAVWSFARRNR